MIHFSSIVIYMKNIDKRIFSLDGLLWWVDVDWLPDPHPATLLLPLLSKAGVGYTTKKLTGQDKDREIAYQLLSQEKHHSTWGKLI